MNNNINLDCQLADQLDSSVQNSMGIQGGTSQKGGELFYNTSNANYANAEGDKSGGSKVSPEMIQAGIATTTALISNISRNRASQGSCKKPLLPESFYNHGKWNIYKDCLRAVEQKRQDEIALAKAQAEARAREAEANAQAEANRRNSSTIDDSSDKILGMPKGLAIGIGVALGLAVVGFVAFKIVKAKKA